MIAITIFGLSVLLALSIILSKLFEQRSQRANFILRLCRKFDPRAESFTNKFRFRILQLVQTVRYLFIVHLPQIMREVISEVQQGAMREYRVSQSIIMGRKNIVNKGAVSFYLKRIKEEKGSERGEIQDNM